MRAWLAVLALMLVACDGDEELRVSGEHAYVRCSLLEPPPPRTWRVGPLRLALEERALRIEGAPSSARVALFTGPVDAASVRALRSRRPHLALMLGGLGKTPAEAQRALDALAGLGVPVLFVAGGGDVRAALEAFEHVEGDARDHVIDASRLRSIRIGKVELVPAAGAPKGRYALSEDACGLGEDDVEAIADAVGDPGEGVRRVLVSWAAPAGGPLSRVLAGVEAGSPLVRELAQRAGAQGAVVAWPREHAGEATSEPFRAVAPPLGGPWVGRADGTRSAPGAMLLTLSDRGLASAARAP